MIVETLNKPTRTPRGLRSAYRDSSSTAGATSMTLKRGDRVFSFGFADSGLKPLGFVSRVFQHSYLYTSAVCHRQAVKRLSENLYDRNRTVRKFPDFAAVPKTCRVGHNQLLSRRVSLIVTTPFSLYTRTLVIARLVIDI